MKGKKRLAALILLLILGGNLVKGADRIILNARRRVETSGGSGEFAVVSNTLETSTGAGARRTGWRKWRRV
ncbi:MAG: hypothetical protein ACYTEQ_02670 [Planctomycetota bacterium]